MYTYTIDYNTMNGIMSLFKSHYYITILYIIYIYIYIYIHPTLYKYITFITHYIEYNYKIQEIYLNKVLY